MLASSEKHESDSECLYINNEGDSETFEIPSTQPEIKEIKKAVKKGRPRPWSHYCMQSPKRRKTRGVLI